MMLDGCAQDWLVISHKLMAGYVVVHDMFILAPSEKVPVDSPAGHVNSPVSEGKKGLGEREANGEGVWPLT